ncbi:MAG: class D sortase [Ruminococcus sp.]|jgi:sortase A|nr:class D sortase [Ruminococcus sp.]
MNTKLRSFIKIIGIIMIVCGVSVIAVFGYRKISHELYMRKLLRESIVFEVPSLDIKVPVLDGTDNKVLAVAAGHFPNTGSVGKGNFCIAGHNSTIYAEIFNDIDKIKIGDTIYLINNDSQKTKYTYVVTAYNIVSPSSVDVLNDFGDNRLTVITCTDDGTKRQVITAMLKNNSDASH